ncbi:uncharacterized protein LOC141926182 isoform X1 [Strix aluco]|uniref:uncharacterized protein LOC141926182 isoform X1 n=1 Tax=Strix aluco TaxID=111821 RepID=UPI003DA6591B
MEDSWALLLDQSSSKLQKNGCWSSTSIQPWMLRVPGQHRAPIGSGPMLALPELGNQSSRTAAPDDQQTVSNLLVVKKIVTRQMSDHVEPSEFFDPFNLFSNLGMAKKLCWTNWLSLFSRQWIKSRYLQIPVFGAGAKAFDGELPACALEAPGQITDLLPLLSKAAKLEVGPFYAMVAPFRRGSQDPSNGPVELGEIGTWLEVRLWAPVFYPIPLPRGWTRTWILLEA